MSQDKNNNKPLKEFKFKFNFYWVYGILFALILGYQFFNSADLATTELSENEFETILNDNDIEKIVVANDDIAQIYIKSEALGKSKHKEKTASPFFNEKNPLYVYKIGDLKNFEDKLRTEKRKSFINL